MENYLKSGGVTGVEVGVAACDHYERSFQRALLQIILSSFLLFSFEDAFTDSLQIKVSFFFHTQRPKSSVAVHTRMQKGQRLKFTERRSDRKREREVKRGGRSTTEEKKERKKENKPLLPALKNAFPAQNGLIPLCPAVLPHCGWPLPCCEEEETASYLHQITFLYTPPH